MKKIFSLVMSITIFLSTFSGNAFGAQQYIGDVNDSAPKKVNTVLKDANPAKTPSANIGILSTNIWASKTTIKTTEQTTISFSYDDEPHPTIVQIYYNGTLLSAKTQVLGKLMSGTYVFDPDAQIDKAGSYEIRIIPTDDSDFYNNIYITVYKPVVVFLPGIMGTGLFMGAEKVWMPQEDIEINKNVTGQIRDHIRALSMSSNGESKNTITVGEPVGDFYKSIYNYLTNNGYDVVYYGYDWRLDNRDQINRLSNTVNEKIQNLPSGAEKKVSIVAHSMGGLVASQYIKSGNQSKIDKLITLGTPFLGAPSAYYIYKTGNIKNNFADEVIKDAIKEIVPNVPALYQLLPSRDYFDLNKKFYIKSLDDYKNEKSIKKSYTTYIETNNYLRSKVLGFNPLLMDRAINFHDNLDIRNTLKLVDSYQIIGQKVATVGIVTDVFIEGGQYNTLPLGDQFITTENTQGDGTVPLYSSTVGGALDPSKTYFIHAEHSDLPGKTEVQQLVRNILENRPNSIPAGISKTGQKVGTLQTRVEGPAEIDLYDASGNHTGLVASNNFMQQSLKASSVYQNITSTSSDPSLSESNIPFSSYFANGNVKFVLSDDNNYSVVIKGTDFGTVDFRMIWFNENDQTSKTIRFDDVPVTPNTVYNTTTDNSENIVLRSENANIAPSVVLIGQDNDDEISPTITSEVIGFRGVNEWYGSFIEDVYYSLTAHDNESGPDKIFYNINDAGYEQYDGTITLNKTGIYNIKSYARDRNKNVSSELEETIKVDKTNPTKPTMTIVPLKWTNQFVSITLSDSQDTDSGFQKYQYKIGQDGEWKDYTTPIIIDTEGLYNVYARAVDNVFNLSEEVVGDAKVDKTMPTTPEGFKILSYNYNQIKISWLPSTDNVGVTSYDVYQDSVLIGSTVDTEFTFNNLLSNRVYTFTIIARDEATNSSLDGVFIVRTPKVLVGTDHTLQARADGSVLAWGLNSSGQLGDGTTTSKTTAVEVPGLTDILSVAAGSGHSLALK
ncbi:OmpL47-type beta-barrel domain-containing protein, partial [Paenibacillus macerans]|uniref:OmpL47-type beta-barrel domain-containing protein n=1 Tax=Paenibacillus macerans TaxID=44252 RepID=UPI003D317359